MSGGPDRQELLRDFVTKCYKPNDFEGNKALTSSQTLLCIEAPFDFRLNSIFAGQGTVGNTDALQAGEDQAAEIQPGPRLADYGGDGKARLGRAARPNYAVCVLLCNMYTVDAVQRPLYKDQSQRSSRLLLAAQADKETRLSTRHAFVEVYSHQPCITLVSRGAANTAARRSI